MKLLCVSFLLALAVTGSQCNFLSLGSKKSNYNFEVLPNHKNATLMARFIVHNVDWTSVSYKSVEKDTLNLTMSQMFSMSDGLKVNGTGVPYFYLTELSQSVKGIFQTDKRCGLMMTLANTDICQKNKWDPEDPRCARVYMTGKLEKIANKTPEFEFAKKVFLARHPGFEGVANRDKFFFVKYVIEKVKIISGFGGVRVVNVKEYFAVKDSKYNLV